MRKFTHKGYGRIFVNKEEDIKIVKDEIKSISEFEFDYLPEKLITTIETYPTLEYTHKFDDLDLDELTYRLYKKGIYIMCIDNGYSEYLSIDYAN